MYDYVIVGAGSAGCVLANRLTADPAVRVLLLEAGGPDKKTEIHIPAAFAKLFNTEYDWAYSTAPEPALAGRELFWPRGKTLGGSSSLNAQMYVRGNRADYDAWAALGNAGWSFRDVLPLFKRSEANTHGASQYHGDGGTLGVSDLRDPNPLSSEFVDAAVEVGIKRNDDINGAEQEGVGLSHVTQTRGSRCSTADAFLKPIRKRPNLTVVTGAHVRRVVLDGTRAVGVEYTAAGATRTEEAAREVVLSGGAINSPQLLMLSGIGPAQHLQDHAIAVACDLPGVGQHLQDHLSVPVIRATNDPVTLLSAESLSNLVKFLALKKGMLTSNVGEAMAFLRSSPALEAPDIQLIFAPVPFMNHGMTVPPGHGVTIGAVLLQPASAGALELASTDPFAAPVIHARYLSDPGGDDLRVLRDGVKVCRQIMAAAALAPHLGDEIWPGDGVQDDGAIDAFIGERAETLYHPTGTCKMGLDPLAVVDPELRVRGVDRLRVVDASVMPQIPRGNTNAPTIMIAEKAAEMMGAPAT
jgi:choline dehydrogenase